jgi:hypothetical protein
MKAILIKQNKEFLYPIIGHDGYWISKLGNIYSSLKSQLLKLQINNLRKGYPYIGLHKNKKIKKYSIHRLVAQTFLPNPENKSQVNHKDGNKKNNHIDNLEWCTPRENCVHAYSLNLSKKVPWSGTPAKKIKQYDLENQYITTYNSCAEAGRSIGSKSYGKISDAAKGKLLTAYGFKWRFDYD